MFREQGVQGAWVFLKLGVGALKKESSKVLNLVLGGRVLCIKEGYLKEVRV